MNVEMFHAFYQRIEEIQTTIIKVDPLVVENIDFQIKTEIDSPSADRESGNRRRTSTRTTTTKCEPDFDDNCWFAECDDSLSESLTS